MEKLTFYKNNKKKQLSKYIIASFFKLYIPLEVYFLTKNI